MTGGMSRGEAERIAFDEISRVVHDPQKAQDATSNTGATRKPSEASEGATGAGSGPCRRDHGSMKERQS